MASSLIKYVSSLLGSSKIKAHIGQIGPTLKPDDKLPFVFHGVKLQK